VLAHRWRCCSGGSLFCQLPSLSCQSPARQAVKWPLHQAHSHPTYASVVRCVSLFHVPGRDSGGNRQPASPRGLRPDKSPLHLSPEQVTGSHVLRARRWRCHVIRYETPLSITGLRRPRECLKISLPHRQSSTNLAIEWLTTAGDRVTIQFAAMNVYVWVGHRHCAHGCNWHAVFILFVR